MNQPKSNHLTPNFNLFFLALFFCSILLHSNLIAQKETYNWYFGSFGGIKFSEPGPIPDVISGTQLSSQEPSTSVSDIDGNILFYSNGQRVWDASNNQMPNGNGLLGGNSSSQGEVAVQQPGSGNIYYLFTTDNLNGPNGLRFSIIDMSLPGNGSIANPLGDVVSGKKNILLLNKSIEGVAATSFSNCKDIWVMGHESGTNTFHTFLLTPTGISPGSVTSIGSVKVNGRGNMMFSPNGDKVALAFSNSITNVEVFEFNRSSGTLTKIIAKIPSSPSIHSDGYGVEFSPNREVLYVTHHLLGFIKQYDLTAIDVAGTQYTFNLSGEPGSGQPKLGPDGKIYIPRNLQNYISVIDNPNILGAGANYHKEGFNLAPGVVGLLGMPQMYFPSNPMVLDSIIINDATCSSKGNFTVYLHGGTPPIKYSNDGGITFQNSNIFLDQDPGKYIVVA